MIRIYAHRMYIYRMCSVFLLPLTTCIEPRRTRLYICNTGFFYYCPGIKDSLPPHYCWSINDRHTVLYCTKAACTCVLALRAFELCRYPLRAASRLYSTISTVQYIRFGSLFATADTQFSLIKKVFLVHSKVTS